MPKTFSAVVPPVTGSRLPNRVQGQPLGSAPLPSTTKSLQAPTATILEPGTSQAEEQFSSPDIHPTVSRALNQLQRDIRASTAQTRADPTANKNLLEGLSLVNGAAGGVGPNVISHGLGAPYRGYRICTVRGGALTAHAAIAPTQANPSQTSLLLWTQFAPFVSGGQVLVDLEVWA